jgi:hypothetical protein
MKSDIDKTIIISIDIFQFAKNRKPVPDTQTCIASARISKVILEIYVGKNICRSSHVATDGQ